MKAVTICLCVAAAAVVIVVTYYYTKREHFELGVLTNEKGKQNFITLYSEPNLNCFMGSADCRLSTGNPGVCDDRTRQCVQLPSELQVYRQPSPSLSPPIGVPDPECQWRGICNFPSGKNGSFGTCNSGLCYPSFLD